MTITGPMLNVILAALRHCSMSFQALALAELDRARAADLANFAQACGNISDYLERESKTPKSLHIGGTA